MSKTTPQENSPPVSGAIAGRAALIVTFYGQRDQLQPVLDQALAAFFGTHPSPTPVRNAGRTLYHHPAANRQVLLEPLTLPGVPAHDATLLQLVLNEPGPASAAWPVMLRRLAASGLYDLLNRLAGEDRFWGYTLVYQAVLAEGTTPEEALQVLHPVLRSDGTPELRPAPLAQTAVPGGMLWLLDIPMDGEGRMAASVYAALVDAAHNDDLVRQVLCGPGAALLMPDLIAHKAYYHIRQYHRPAWISRYKQQVAALRNSSQAILKRQTRRPDPHDTAFASLKQTYADLLNATSLLETLRIILHEQQANYDGWPPAMNLGEVHAYHRQHMTHAAAYLHLLVESGRTTLEVARTAVEIVQTELEQMEERRMQNVAVVLAVAGTVLALPQLVTWEVACGVLVQWEMVTLPTCTDYRALEPLILQMVVVGFIPGIIGLGYLLRRWRGRRQNESLP